jgi:RNA polymerase sigma-70 factor (ECF subfamily)
MSTIEVMQSDEATFGAQVERHRRELQVHCYRMLGSLEDSEDLVQETFLRAWRKRDTYAGRASVRAWLYRIATNACLDALERRPRRLPPPAGPVVASPGIAAPPRSEVTWLQPVPDELLAASEAEPDAAAVEKETIELAFMVAIQHVPPRPRAVLIVRDVLGWSANETAALLDTSVAAVNSALQRARATMKEQLPERRAEWAPGADPSEQERALLQRYVDAVDQGDAAAVAALIREDATFTMPPDPQWWAGRDAMVAAWLEGGFGTEAIGEFRCTVTYANRQPAVANYVRKPGDTEFRPLAIDVLRIEDGMVADITAFTGDAMFAAFGLPPTL